MEVEQRPREKALRYGLESLSDLELVALILQSGNKNRSVFEIASDVLKESEGLSKLMSMHVNTLMQIQGIREVKALQLLASVEICETASKEIGKIEKEIDDKEHNIEALCMQLLLKQ